MTVLPASEILAEAHATESARDRVARLFDTHSEYLYRLARRLCRSTDDALDIVQETFLRAARSTSTIPAGSRAEQAWLVRVLVNIQRDAWRRRSVRWRYDAAARRDAAAASSYESTFVAKATVWKALERLPPRRRAILVMRELDALPIPSIASLLGISQVTVRWHLAMARRDLAKLLGGTR